MYLFKHVTVVYAAIGSLESEGVASFGNSLTAEGSVPDADTAQEAAIMKATVIVPSTSMTTGKQESTSTASPGSEKSSSTTTYSDEGSAQKKLIQESGTSSTINEDNSNAQVKKLGLYTNSTSVTDADYAPEAAIIRPTAIVPSTSMTTGKQESTSSASSTTSTTTIYSGEGSTQNKLIQESGASTINVDNSKAQVKKLGLGTGSPSDQILEVTSRTSSEEMSIGQHDETLKITAETSSQKNVYITSTKGLSTHITETSKDGHTSVNLSTFSSKDISEKSMVHSTATSVNDEEGISAIGTQKKDIASTTKSVTTINSDTLLSTTRPSNAMVIAFSQSLEGTPKAEGNPTIVDTASTTAIGTTPSTRQSFVGNASMSAGGSTPSNEKSSTVKEQSTINLRQGTQLLLHHYLETFSKDR